MKNDDEFHIDLHERLARNLDWNLLRTFVAIVQYGGISRAAEHIHLTQPAVSHALKRLEMHLECKLIERTGRRFEITPEGRTIFEKAVDIHNQVSRLGDIATGETRQVFGHVRLLFASRLKSQLLDNLIVEFHRNCPGITLRIDVLPSIEIQSIILQGSASAGFSLLRGKPKDLGSILLLRQRFGLYCGPDHPLFGQKGLSSSDLSKQDIVSFPSDHVGGVLSPLTIYREQRVYEGRVVATSYSLDELIRLTRIGVGIGLLPTHIADELVRDRELWPLPPEKGIGPIDIHLIWNPKTNLSEAEKVFLDFARRKVSGAPMKLKTANV